MMTINKIAIYLSALINISIAFLFEDVKINSLKFFTISCLIIICFLFFGYVSKNIYINRIKRNIDEIELTIRQENFNMNDYLDSKDKENYEILSKITKLFIEKETRNEDKRIFDFFKKEKKQSGNFNVYSSYVPDVQPKTRFNHGRRYKRISMPSMWS